MKIFHSEQVLAHDPLSELNRGKLGPPYERPERAARVAAALTEAGLGPLCEALAFPDAHVLRVHDAGLVEFLHHAHRRWRETGRDGDAVPMCWRAERMAPANLPTAIDAQLGFYGFDIMTPISGGTWRAARSSVDAALSGADHIVTGKGTAAFALCRPPGHHAGANYYGGYCFLNSAAVAAQYLLDRGMERVAIFDPDYHHGNGTQDIFYARSDVLYVSIHADPVTDFPFYSGFAGETGRGAGEGFNLNIPLPRGTGWHRWSEAYAVAEERIRKFSPDAWVVSLGVDTLGGDPLSRFEFVQEDFLRLGNAIARAACPVLFVFEGGYSIGEIGASVAGALQGFLQRRG